MINNFKDEWIVKSNKLVSAKMKFAVNEYKLITYLLGKIKMDDKEFRTFDISISELNKYCFGIEGTATYNQIKRKYTKSFIRKHIVIKGDIGETMYNWFSIIDTNKKRGVLSICFNKDLEDFLLDIGEGNYTKYRLSNILGFNTFYGIRLYEIMKQYEKLGKRYVSVNDLKFMLGIEEEKIKIYRDFRKRIIIPSIEAMNEKTDIKVKFEEDRLGRIVEGINFYIVSKRTIYKPKELIEIKEKIESILNKEVNINILEKAIKQNELKKEDIYYYLDHWDSFDYKRLKNPVGFLLMCVEDKIPLPVSRAGTGNKPEQSTNFEQREYDDEFFENLYDNF
jgi:plasmid replication initiation protein